MEPALRVAFAGTPEFAAHALEAILAAGCTVPVVLTQPDRSAGRGMKLAASAVKQLALARGLAIDQPERLRTDEERARLKESRPDVLVVAAYGLILPPEALALPRMGCLNIHASLLPRWRGAAPIQRAIEAGDEQTGITIMQMDAGLDTGPMLLCRKIDIAREDTAASLHDKLARLGAEAIVEALARLAVGNLPAEAQPATGVTIAKKISRAEAGADWRRPATELARQVRAFNPFPVAFALARETTIKLWAAHTVSEHGEPGSILRADASGLVVACGEDALCVTELQRPGSRRMAAAEFLRGFTLTAGERFSLPVAQGA
ncbi:methionyl-tRNA formyltransferase [Azonexus sp.]|jgi:methionyl-tRNA formyltransferase|uniref:methionyl-tRNA formyltransferase n=1 Tax=Azonexus sp. TaxID=1872668 RepID=UPI0028324481|nr:methionyl-tRNA formyltransferase [Azonexus sp.]MDR1994758.1 methionyl-tRNA formyltransferase [Azonexus sp.]